MIAAAPYILAALAAGVSLASLAHDAARIPSIIARLACQIEA